MALCTECGTALPGGAKDCPACGARRHPTGWERDAAAKSVVSYSAPETEIAFAEVRLVTTPQPGDGRSNLRGGPGAVDVPTGNPRPAVRSRVGANDLALCALVLGIVSVVFALLALTR